MRGRVPAGNEKSRPTEQTFQSIGSENPLVEPKMEAAGIEPAQGSAELRLSGPGRADQMLRRPALAEQLGLLRISWPAPLVRRQTGVDACDPSGIGSPIRLPLVVCTTAGAH